MPFIDIIYVSIAALRNSEKNGGSGRIWLLRPRGAARRRRRHLNSHRNGARYTAHITTVTYRAGG